MDPIEYFKRNKMKRLTLFPAVLFLLLNLFSQQKAPSSSSHKIHVPVRVFDEKSFVEDLSIQDFMLYENGKLQKIESLYFFQDGKIKRKETNSLYVPPVQRNFFLFFQLIEYHPKLAEVIDFLFQEVIQPGDNLTFVTPIKQYNMSSQALRRKSKQDLSKEMQKILRKDIKIGESNYRNMIKDLKWLVRSISSSAGFGSKSNIASGFESEGTSSSFSIEFLLPRYRNTLAKVEQRRIIDKKMLYGFANSLKRLEGQNTVFFFYQREFRPEIKSNILNQMIDLYEDKPHIQASLSDLFQFYRRDIHYDVERISQIYADAAPLFNFLFMNKPQRDIFGIDMREQSEDIFKLLSQIATSTGGYVSTSQNPVTGFKKAAEFSEKAYLLTYSPSENDGEFIHVDVKIKDKNYSVSHRQGYIKQPETP